MRPFCCVAACAALWASTTLAAADSAPLRRFDFGVSLGYAVPMGDAEKGGHVRDTTFGTVPIALDAGYRLLPRIGVGAHLQYGLGIPTLCQTASDCESSLGSDAVAVLAARIYLPELGRIDAVADVGIGYEWLTTRLSDAGATSTRVYQGPVLLSGMLAAPFRLGRGWTFGPVVGWEVTTFATYALETNLGTTSGNVPARAVHAWTKLGIRLAYSP